MYYFSVCLCLFLHVLPSEVFRTTRAATREQPAIRAFHCNRVSPSLQSGWSRLGRLGRSLKGSREPRHPKENQTPQQFGLKVFLFCCWTTVSCLRAMSLHLYFSKRKPCMGQPLVSSLKEAPAASITLKKPKKSAGTKKATKKLSLIHI